MKIASASAFGTSFHWLIILAWSHATSHEFFFNQCYTQAPQVWGAAGPLSRGLHESRGPMDLEV